jgi:hypothetical protein
MRTRRFHLPGGNFLVARTAILPALALPGARFDGVLAIAVEPRSFE